MKIKAHHLVIGLWFILLGSVICCQFDCIKQAYEVNHTDFKEQKTIVLIMFIGMSLVIAIKLFRYYGLLLVLLLPSCKTKHKLVEPNTVYWSVDSVENIEDTLYNEWE